MASKMVQPNFLKETSNQCICSKDWWELWIVGKDRKKKKQKSSAVRSDSDWIANLVKDFFLWSTIHSSHQSLEQMHWFEAIFGIWGRAVFETIEVKRRSILNFEAATTFINLLQNCSLLIGETIVYCVQSKWNLQRLGSKQHFCQLRVPIMVLVCPKVFFCKQLSLVVN